MRITCWRDAVRIEHTANAELWQFDKAFSLDHT